MKKKILITFIATFTILFALCMINVSAASSGTCGDNLIWTLDDEDVLTISGNGAMYGYYREESPWYHCRGNITSVIIEEGVTSIGSYAFYECDAMVSINIPESLKQVGNSAFNYCNAISRVNIKDMESWCRIKFFNAESNPLFYAANLYVEDVLVSELVIPPNIETILDFSFAGCGGLVNVNIPNGVKTIGNSAFYKCRNLISVNVSDTVESIGESSFQHCSKLANINLGKGVVNICNQSFFGCTELASIIIPDNVATIGDSVFYECKKLTSIIIPNSVTTVGEGTFSGCTSISNVTIGHGLKSIPPSLFYKCGSLKSIYLPVELKYIRSGAFEKCENIETVFYEGSEQQWNEILFYDSNENLTNAELVFNWKMKTYKFVTNCDVVLSDITDYAIFTMPTVENDGMTLTGWYDNEALSGNPVTFPYYGDATTLYAAWTDRTGKSFEDAFIAKANQEYTVTTTESGQLVYFEFVPNFSKEYRFYTTGSKDTYGYLYNSNKSQIASNDDSGDGNNFYISYNLTAGETYYIAAKLYSGTGTFTLVMEEPVDYRINEITIKDMSGNSLQAIPTGTFLATVSFTNVSSSADTVIILAQYTDAGAFKGLMYIQTEDVPTGSTIKLSIPVDNSSGDVTKLKAFCWESFNSLTPMGNSVSFPAE